MAAFSGVIPPLCTPLDAHAAVDPGSLERLVRAQLDAGVRGVFALGSSGEAIYLDDAARRRVLDVVVGAVAGEVPVFAGAVAGSTNGVIEQVRWIGEFAVDAIVVTAPFYAVVSEAETARHFEAIAAASPVPIIAYDIPGNVGRKLPVELTIDLLRRGVLGGLKDTSGDLHGFFRIVESLGSPRQVSLLTGSDAAAAESLAGGADGLVPGIGNVVPEACVALYDAYERGDAAAAARVQDRVTRAASIFPIGMRYGLGRHASELGALKWALHRQGIFATPLLSAPLTQFPPEAGREVLAILSDLPV